MSAKHHLESCLGEEVTVIKTGWDQLTEDTLPYHEVEVSSQDVEAGLQQLLAKVLAKVTPQSYEEGAGHRPAQPSLSHLQQPGALWHQQIQTSLVRTLVLVNNPR